MSNSFGNQSLLERVMNRLVGPFVTIFTIHRPEPKNGAYNGANEDLLKRCLDYAAKKNYHFTSVDQLVEDAFESRTPNQPTLCFTLDDGYADQATRLLPILIDYKTSPNLFVITDFIDQKIWPWDAKISYLIWSTPLSSCTALIGDKKLGLDLSTKAKRIAARRRVIQTIKKLEPNQLLDAIDAMAEACQLRVPDVIPNEFAPISWQGLRDLESKGVKIGSHTKSHLVFNAASDQAIRHELEYSRTRLQAELVNPSSVFCYPLGSYNDFSRNHIQLVKEAGYNSAITTLSNITNFAEIRKQPFQIQRIAFPNNFETFVRYTSWREVVRGKFPF